MMFIISLRVTKPEYMHLIWKRRVNRCSGCSNNEANPTKVKRARIVNKKWLLHSFHLMIISQLFFQRIKGRSLQNSILQIICQLSLRKCTQADKTNYSPTLRQRTSAHSSRNDRVFNREKSRITGSSTIHFRFDTLRLLPVPEYQRSATQKVV